MIPGDLVRLKHNYGKVREGARGVIVGFYRNEGGENVVVRFDEGDEMVPWVELEVVENFDRLRDERQT
jgi:hypothetical protein